MNKKIKSILGSITAIAGVAAAVVGGVADDDDAVSELVQKELNNRETKIEYVDVSEPPESVELEPAGRENEEEAEVPLWRGIVSIPLWIVTHIISGLIFPVAGRLAGWIFVAAAIVAIVALGIKAVFPDMALKDILTKKTVGPALAGAGLLILADIIPGAFCASYIKWKNIFRLVMGLVVILLIVIHRCRRLGSRKAAKFVLPGELI